MDTVEEKMPAGQPVGGGEASGSSGADAPAAVMTGMDRNTSALEDELSESDTIRDGDYIVIKKGTSMWLHKLNANGKNPVSLKKDQVWLGAVVGRPFFSQYRLVAEGGKRQRCFSLKEVERPVDVTQEFLVTGQSGRDNRNIVDDGHSQKLSGEEIVQLQEKGLSGKDIVGQLVQNSRTFHEKTEYSQEKYLKKKQRKYLEYVTVQKPTLRLVSQILYNRNPNKIMNLRPDTLSQLLAYCNVRSGGHYLVYETGCQGLVTAAILERLRGTGFAIHVHPGNIPQRQAVLAMNFSTSELQSLHSLNVSHLLRSIADKKEASLPSNGPEEALPDRKRKAEDSPDVPAKRPKLLQTLWAESQASLQLLSECSAGLDAIVIAGREDPLGVIQLLLPFLGMSRPFAAFCPHQEPLVRCYCSLKERGGVINMRLTETWLRNYQVLPDRTHPHISMSGSGGFLLTGLLVEGKGAVAGTHSRPNSGAANPVPHRMSIGGQDEDGDVLMAS